MRTIIVIIILVVLILFVINYLVRSRKEDCTVFGYIIKSTEFINSPEKQTIQKVITIENKPVEITFYKYNTEKFIILIKTLQKYKGNFEGICYSTFDENSIKIVNSKEYFSINGTGIFEELYIKRKISPQCYKVYFDLN
ncbi:asparagine N-glycosylation enzyme membrane subunit Stt3 [Chryseobacterium defluvii]|uniref:Asparagine N-glycosylation enzyme membrane subunit Stt3 n=1 Tax=Chryseobacterium defluvii TaxID=160396 RepID=A0A840K8U3_9FLAO|nr:hypothetical protein [Chryseobacterium defluvii]MBB4804825.1 asparagine N-glycosylation enzyme membrane subunit Stt3 [Chryseobacterium defluvii]